MKKVLLDTLGLFVGIHSTSLLQAPEEECNLHAPMGDEGQCSPVNLDLPADDLFL